jgi:hypothetical protein
MKSEMFTDNHDGDLVVFLIGMRPHRTWRLDQTFYVANAMRRMLAELERDRKAGADLGFLGGYAAFGPFGPLVVQYWRSFADLDGYANAAELEHRPAWLKVYKMAHEAGATRVGFWHETYQVPAGAHESIYVAMPPAGLSAAVGAQPLDKRGRTARERINA